MTRTQCKAASRWMRTCKAYHDGRDNVHHRMLLAGAAIRHEMELRTDEKRERQGFACDVAMMAWGMVGASGDDYLHDLYARLFSDVIDADYEREMDAIENREAYFAIG